MAHESPRRKALLFCLHCEHASPPDGDWVLTSGADGGVVYRCPECDRVLERRPSYAGDARRTVTACD